LEGKTVGDEIFRHILVPLDGSRLAESALATAVWLATKMSAQLTLIHVIEKKAPSAVHSDRHLVTPEEATRYLEEVSRRTALTGLRVETHVHTVEVGDVARSIAEHSAELSPDLVVMCTHGKGGARRLLFGVIAQQVIALGRTPVLMVRPSKETPVIATMRDFRTILVPIDGDPGHEKGLPMATEIAQALHCRLHLLMVVPELRDLTGSKAAASFILPGATRLNLEIETAGAQTYLDQRATELKGKGIMADYETSRGDPARAIIASALRLSADLVVMGTHGRAGADAFWAGSVAARVVARIQAPLMLVPLGRGDDKKAW
jgi:nucleotide-binding universal stress UspA family protein